MSKPKSETKNYFSDLPLDEVSLKSLGNYIYYKGYYFEENSEEDRASTLKWILTSILDGRPQPFSLYGSNARKPADDPRRRLEELMYFAEVGELSPRYPTEEAAIIGNYTFSIEELVELHKWIESVIKWHQKNLAGKA